MGQNASAPRSTVPRSMYCHWHSSFQGRHLAQLAQILLPSMFAFAQRFAERRGKLRNIPLPVMLRAFIGIFLAFLFTEMVLKNMPLLKNADYDWFGGMVDIYLHGILEPEA